jgi:hypothetical protein
METKLLAVRIIGEVSENNGKKSLSKQEFHE